MSRVQSPPWHVAAEAVLLPILRWLVEIGLRPIDDDVAAQPEWQAHLKSAPEVPATQCTGQEVT